MVFGILARAVEYNEDNPERIQHLLKVHSFARIIGKADKFDEKNQKTTELAAILLNIGFKEAERKYNSTDSYYQETVGEKVARQIMEDANVPGWIEDRVSYIVRHHNTFSEVDGPDFQAAIEANALVNIYEKNLRNKEKLEFFYENLFKTKKGKQLFKQMYLTESYMDKE